MTLDSIALYLLSRSAINCSYIVEGMNTCSPRLPLIDNLTQLFYCCLASTLVCIIFSAYYKLISTAFRRKSYYFQPQGLLTQRSRANGEGIHGLEGLDWEGWRVVVVPGGWGVGELKPNTEST